MSYTTALFDLDGTLTDSGPGITNSVAYALQRLGIDEPDRAKLYRFIGPPLIESFMRFYGLSTEDSRRGVTLYREYYHDRGIFENSVYDGIPAVLDALRTRGVRLAVATSKPEQYTLRILDHFGLAPCFELVAGATMDETRTQKDQVIAYALSRLPGVPRTGIVMIGDRHHDIEGAARNGLDSVGVLYGFGTREELCAAGASHIAERPHDILVYF